MLKVLRQTSHLIYILNICYLQTTYICLKYISYKFLLFHLHLFIMASYLHYAHTCIQKGIPCYHTFIQEATSIFIHPLQRISCPFYLPIHTYYCKVFFILLRCKVSNMGQPKFEQKLSQANPNFHVFLILKPNFGFLAISMFPCIEATGLGS